MAQALVLGATGHIGSHIVRALLAQGHQVRAAYRRSAYAGLLDGLTVERVLVDLETGQGLSEALAGCDWVFHAAGYYPAFRASGAQRERAIELGAASVRRFLDAAQRARSSRIVFTSSASTIRRVEGRSATEEDAEPWPLESWRPLYATVKIAMEHEVRRAAASGLPAVITNPSVCFGEYDAHPFSGRLILLFAKRRLPWYTDHRFDAVYTGDVGAAHVGAAERGAIGERYLLTTAAMTIKALAVTVSRFLDRRPPRWRLPHALLLSAAYASEALARCAGQEPWLPVQMVTRAHQHASLDGSKAVRAFGIPRTPIETAIARALQWFQRHGYC